MEGVSDLQILQYVKPKQSDHRRNDVVEDAGAKYSNRY